MLQYSSHVVTYFQSEVRQWNFFNIKIFYIVNIYWDSYKSIGLHDLYLQKYNFG